MTDEEIARANAEWEAMPGTPPNAYSFRSLAEIGDRDVHQVIREMRAMHPNCAWVRVTKTEQGIWLEAWDKRPRKQAPFNPPVVYQ